MSLIFIRKYFFYLIGLSLIGIGTGYFLTDEENNTLYYEMQIKPNYNSGNYMLDKIEYLNKMLAHKNFEIVSKDLEISLDQVHKIKHFIITPEDYTRDKIIAYENFIRENDTLALKEITFEDFNSKNFNDRNTFRYTIEILVSSYFNLDLEPNLIHFLENNKDLIAQKDFNTKVFNLEERHLKRALEDIDSIRVTNRRVALKQAENLKNIGTKIDLINNESSKKKKRKLKDDLNLFNTSNELMTKLKNLYKTKKETLNIINITSELRPQGIYDKAFGSNKMVLYTFLFIGLFIGGILLFKLNIYLKNYKK